MKRPPRPLLYRLHRELAALYAGYQGRPPAAEFGALASTLLSSSMTVIGHRSTDQRHALQWWPQRLDLTRHNAAYEALVHEHPVRNRFRATRDPGPHTFSDALTLASLKSSALYVEYFRHYEITRMMAVYAPLSADSHVSLGVSRNGSDFTDEERLTFASLQPHLAAAVRREVSEATRPPLPFDFALDAGAAAELTDREAEVLQWIAAGKSNPEIAIILGVSRLTVKTHVERILRKLGVENRVAALAAVRSRSR